MFDFIGNGMLVFDWLPDDFSRLCRSNVGPGDTEAYNFRDDTIQVSILQLNIGIGFHAS